MMGFFLLVERSMHIKCNCMSIHKTDSNKRSLKQIPLRHRTFDEIRELVNFLKEKGYKILHGLDNLKEDDLLIGGKSIQSERLSS